MRRKITLAAAALAAGIVLTYLYNIYFAIFVGFLPMIFLYIVFDDSVTEKNKKSVIYIFCIFIFGCLLITCCERYQEQSPLKLTEGENCHYTGMVYQIDKKSDDEYRIYCRVMNRKVLIRYYKSIDDYWNLYGKTINFSTAFEKPASAGNPRTFDYSLYLKSKGIYYIGTTSFYNIDGQNDCSWETTKGFIIKKREAFLNLFKCNDETKGFIRAVMFGDTSKMSDEIYEDFRNNGTAHILAVSGLHVGLLYALYAEIYKRRKKTVYTIVFIIVLFIYGTAALWSFSVTRAVFLIVIKLIGNLLDRRYDTLTSLAFAGMVITVINPYAVFNTGFQMSFLAVASLAFISPYIEKWTGRGMSAIIGVQIGLIPYTVYMFNYIPLAAIICNIPVVWLASVFVPFGILLFAVYFVTGCFSDIGSALFYDLGNVIIYLNRVLSARGFFSLEIASPKLWVVVLIYLCIFFFTSEYSQVFLKRKDKKAFVMPVLIMAVAFLIAIDCSINSFDAAKVVFVDVGQGDCIHLKSDRKTDLLFDGGGSVNYNVGKKILKPYLLRNGISDIDLAFVTHTHTDHYRGIEELDNSFKIKRKILKGKAGNCINLPNGDKIMILWPEEYNSNADETDENSNCMVFKIVTEKFSVLITGDITEEGEKKLLSKYRGTDVLKADILKVSHHGSRYSSCTEFLDEVRPKSAVICVGKNNYGHPSNETIEKLRKKGIMVFRTDYSGAVGIISSEKGIFSVCTIRKP